MQPLESLAGNSAAFVAIEKPFHRRILPLKLRFVDIEGVEDIQFLYLVASFVANFEDNFDIKRNFLFNFRYEIHIFVNLISNIYINNYN